MNQDFFKITQNLEPLLNKLLNMKPVKPSALPKIIPLKGIYLFSEEDQHMYVGRSNTIRKRIQNHCRPSSIHTAAAFAFRIAREETGMLDATYEKEGSRKELMNNAVFLISFSSAKERIKKMDLRYIEVKKPINQAIFEIFVHLALLTKYNDFENH